MHRIDGEGTRLVDAARRIAREVAARHAVDVDARARFPEEAVRALAESGLFGLNLPRGAGGCGQPPTSFVAVVEELAQACGSTAMIYVMHVAGAQAIAASETLGGRDGLLSEIAAGRHLTTLAFSERGSRSHFWAPVSRLAESPRGGFLAGARKSWVTSASFADSYVCTSLAPRAETPRDTTLYLVDRRAPGVRIEARFDGVGLRGNDSSPVTLEDVEIPADRLLTELGQGPATTQSVVLPWFVLGTSAMANGLCRAALTATVAHLATSRLEHLDSALRDLPNLQTRLAEMSVRTEQSRALLAHAARAMEAPDDSTPLFVLQSRLAAVEAAVDVADLAMKACGGAAFSKHLGIERLFRDARAGWVMAPTADHLQTFVGRVLVGLPPF